MDFYAKTHKNADTAIPDLLRLGREVVRAALPRCFGAGPDSARDGPGPGSDGQARPCRFLAAAVDGTCGNGHDTLFLAQSLAEICRGPHGVFAFDIQPRAIAATRARLGALANRVSLLPENHARLGELLADPGRYPPSLASFFTRTGGLSPEETSPAGHEPPFPLRLGAAMYNLGFLPRSDRSVATSAPDTLTSLRSAAGLLAPGGILAVHAYGGHPGGREELEAVEAWHGALPFSEWIAASYALRNKRRNPEALLLAEKRWKR